MARLIFLVCFLLIQQPFLLAQTNLRDSLLKVARSEGADSIRAEALNRLANTYMNKVPDSMELFAREALLITQRLNHPVLQARTLQKIAIAQQQQGLSDSAAHYLQSALGLFEQVNYRKGMIEASVNLANILYIQGDYVEAERFTLRALELAREKESWTRYRIPSLVLLANIWQLTDQPQKASGALQEALSLAGKSPNGQKNIPYIITNLSSLHREFLHQPDSAKYFLEREMQQERTQKNPDALIDMLISMGDINGTDQKHWEEAQVWYQKSLSLARDQGLKRRIPMILGRMAETRMETGQWDAAAQYLGQSLELSRQNKEAKNLMSTYRLAISLDSLRGDLPAAFGHIRELRHLEDSILGVEKKMALQELEQQIELGEREHTIRTLEKEKEFKSQWNRLLILALVLICLLASGLIWYQFRIIRKKKELALKESELSISREKLMENALEREKMDNELLQKELDFKSQRLQDMATLLSSKKELIREITDQLKGLNEGPAHDSLKAVLHQLQPHLQLDRDQMELELYMEKSSQTFFLALEDKYPGLTKTDKKLSSLIRMGMSNREIGILLNINTRSAEMGRYRLRKKLQLQPETDLQGFLKGLSF